MGVAGKVSPIATVPQVRDYVDRKLREFGSAKRIVMDGRDIGTTVFPEAELKLFMTADPNFLDFFDFISNSVIMPIVALLTCIFVGYVIKPKTLSEEIALTGKFKSEKIFTVIIKYIAPVCILAILISSVLNGLGVIKI